MEQKITRLLVVTDPLLTIQPRNLSHLQRQGMENNGAILNA
jgi:hypothetical protein